MLCGIVFPLKEFEMVICPKCGYRRQQNDDDFVSKSECPKCGIVYEKFERAQNPLKPAGKVIGLKNRKPNRAYFWSAAAWLLVICIFIAWSNSFNKPAPADFNPDSRKIPTGFPQPKPVYNAPALYTSPPPLNDGGRQLSNAARRLLEVYNKPLDSSHYYQNVLDEYEWDDIKSLPNYAGIRSILWNYHRQHTYVGNDFFVCVDMALEVWDLMRAAGIPARLMVGNAQTDITLYPTVAKYLAAMNHAWVLVEVSPSTWIPLETTGGFIVEPSMPNFGLYNVGAMFETPKEFKEFCELRKSMFATCKDIGPMRDNFNRLYAGRAVTGETAQYTGRIEQRIDDCQGLVGRVTSLLQPR